jgi:hypothetical protein
MITLELTESEYQSVYQSIKEASLWTYPKSKEQHQRNLNVVLLKMMKSRFPEFCKNIGPW